MKSNLRRRDRFSSGVALVLVLCFIVLLTAMILALLSRSITAGLISDSSASLNDANLYGEGAIEQVIGDLRQEIAAGSIVASVTPVGGVGSIASPYKVYTDPNTEVISYIYRPSSAAAAVPFNSGPAAYGTGAGSVWNTTFPNLVKESARGVPFYQGYDSNAPTRAISLGTDVPSLNGRFVSSARWNKHLLLQKSSTTTTDTTPASAFILPDWILTTVDPTLPVPATFTSPMANPQDGHFVVGRYAYAIYNEGGLLDVNVAGSPSGLNGAQSLLWSKKGPQTFADLTQIPGITQSISNSIVGWRNYSTLQATGSAPTFAPFNNVNGYFSSILGLSTRFITVSTTPTTSFNGGSDHVFSTRQQLISFLQMLAQGDARVEATLQNSLMYLTTFSRSLNQPSYWPDPNRPIVVSAPASPTSSTYNGGNSAYQLDNVYNPPFKSARVIASFTRFDGTKAIPGEPLVKKRFPLNRLAWITSNGSSAKNMTSLAVKSTITALGGDPNNSSDPIYQYVANGTDENILACFGLKWVPASSTSEGYWLYDHGVNDGSGDTLIATLNGSQAVTPPLTGVASLNRDPDFFELLKAAINVGSLAKSYPHPDPGYTKAPFVQQSNDGRVDLHILQIGANIIDQFKSDDYPTEIRLSNGSIFNRIYGSQDLPYLNAIHDEVYISKAANPQPSTSNGAREPNVTPPTVFSSGTGVWLTVPSVWDPYALPNSPLNSALVPTNLRATIISTDPDKLTSPSNNVYYASIFYNGYPQGQPTPNGYTVAAKQATESNWTDENLNAITFSFGDSANPGYRNPSLLWLNTAPSGSGALPTYTYSSMAEAGSLSPVFGFLLGTFPLRIQEPTLPLTNPPTLSIYTAVMASASFPPDGLTVRLEYQAAGSNAWIPYQEVWFNGNDGGIPIPLLAPTGSTDLNAVAMRNRVGNEGGEDGSHLIDPRTIRWVPIGSIAEPLLNSSTTSAGDQATLESLRSAGSPHIHGGGAGLASSAGWVSDGAMNNPGLYSQNITGLSAYYSDADGVVRRAMSAYNPDVSSSSTNLPGLPMQPYVSTGTTAYSSRPIMLHRPFRSVSELGYVFRGTPWKNIDFFTPESGDGALLDIFCINEDYRPDALSAGQVDLNGKQPFVFQALLKGAYRDEFDALGATALLSTEAQNLAKALVARTESTSPGKGPLMNVADLVGRWIPGGVKAAPINGSTSYDGFSADLGSLYAGGASSANGIIQRYRESSMRALADAGQAGTWNLLIDLVVQSGRYPATATGLGDFLVQGERHYWVHVALDRSTGQVIDENIEVVNE